MTGFVYFIEAENGLIKIGYTNDISRRLTALQTGSPVKLTLIGQMPGTVEDEKQLHRRFVAYRRGGEWFDGADEIVELARAYPPPGRTSTRNRTIRPNQIAELAELINQLVDIYGTQIAFAAALMEILPGEPASTAAISNWKVRGLAPAWRYPVWYLAQQNGIHIDLHEFMTGAMPAYSRSAA